VLGLEQGYGVAPGRPASFLLLPAGGPFDVVRRQVRPSHVFAHGRLVASTPPAVTTLTWPGRATQPVDFVRASETAPVAATPRA
jgi:cytosine deaminase